MNDIINFTNNELGTIRTILIDNKPYFVGKDVADILEYQNGSRDINRHVDIEDRRKLMFSDGTQKRETIFINESGLYSLILASKLPSAKKFKRWVTSEVLPTIRKYGAYMTDETLKKAITSPDFVIKLAQQLKDEQVKRQEIEARNEVLIKENNVMKPKALFADCVSASEQCITVAELAKFISQHGNVHIGEKRLFQYLRDNGYLMNRVIDKNTPTQKSIELGLFNTEEVVIVDSDKTILSKAVKVTPKGQQYFINKIKNI